jgi:RHS repeat-associated protein
VDAAGATTNYTYDALDRVLTTTYPADAPENVTYAYDQAGHGFGVGRLTSVTDAVGSLSRTYDERGNLLTESRVHGGVTLLTSTTYDAASRIASITYPSGAKASYARDAMGRITAVTMTAKTGSAQAVASAIGYQPFGPVSGFTFANGIAESRSFDLDYRLTNLTGTGSGTVQNLTYGYNAADNVLSIADAVHSGNSQTLGYDTLDRLTSATGAYGSLAYSYDSVGNRLTQQAGATSTTYTYTAQSNRLTQIRTGSALQVLSYTPAGNITTFANVPNTRPAIGIAYNQANRLATVLSGGQQTMQYTYDAFGQRLVKVGTLTATTLSQYDQGGHLLEQTDGSGSPQVDYVYLGDRPVATFQPSNGKLYFLHDDRLGTPQAATDSSQSVAWSANYEPFGTTSPGVNAIAQDLRLPGQEFEVETGWNHNGFRDYAPALGRYLESDPIGLAGGLNTYRYAGANPMRLTDRSGLLLDQALAAALERAAVVEVVGGGPEDPIGDVLALGIILSALDGRQAYIPTSADSQERRRFQNNLNLNQNGKAAEGKAAAEQCPSPNALTTPIPGTSLVSYYPPNSGFTGIPEYTILPPGTQLGRWGGEGGTYLSPLGTQPNKLSLPPGTTSLPYTVYTVVKPLPVLSGRAAGWFYQSGGGTQYLTFNPVDYLIENGYLK